MTIAKNSSKLPVCSLTLRTSNMNVVNCPVAVSNMDAILSLPMNQNSPFVKAGDVIEFPVFEDLQMVMLATPEKRDVIIRVLRNSELSEIVARRIVGEEVVYDLAVRLGYRYDKFDEVMEYLCNLGKPITVTKSGSQESTKQ